MTDNRDWIGKVGHTWAAEWRRTDRSFRELTPQLVAAARDGGFAHALDIGCGAGEITCALATAQADAHVTGIDISAELLEVARSRCDGHANTAFAHVNADSFVPLHAPDLIVSRHGVMFFADPVAAFTHMRTHAQQSARLAFSCFRTRGQNGWVDIVLGALNQAPEPPADPHAPGPFAFGDHDHVHDILDAAGWHDIAFRQVDYRMVMGEGEHPVSDAIAYLQRIGPAATPLANLLTGERIETLERLGVILEDYRDGDVVSLPASAWLVTARAQ